jgi:hypothetical protein
VPPPAYHVDVAWGDGWLPNHSTPQWLRETRVTLDKLATAAACDPTVITILV